MKNSPWRTVLHRSFPVLVLLWIGLVVIADWFFFGNPLGWTVGLYLFLLTGAVWLKGGRSLCNIPGMFLTGILAALGINQIEHPGALNIMLSLTGLVTLSLISREGWRNDVVKWVKRWWVFSRRVFSQIIYDSRIVYKWRSRHGRPNRIVKHWFIPAVLSLGFVFLFSVANPVISEWMSSCKRFAADLVTDFFTYVPAARMFLWLVSGFFIWGLLRTRTKRQGVVIERKPQQQQSDSSETFTVSPSFIVRCLVV